MGNEHQRQRSAQGVPSSSTKRSQRHFDDKNKQEPRTIRPMGFNLLQELVKSDDMESIICQLSNDRKGFKQLLESNDIKGDLIVMIVKIWSKIYHSSFQNNVIGISETILRSKFIETLVSYISTLILQVSLMYIYIIKCIIIFFVNLVIPQVFKLFKDRTLFWDYGSINYLMSFFGRYYVFTETIYTFFLMDLIEGIFIYWHISNNLGTSRINVF